MKTVLLASLTLMLAACDGSTRASTDGTVDGIVLVSNRGGAAEIQEFTLKDGTRCAALIGSYKGGITCDWEHSPKTP